MLLTEMPPSSNAPEQKKVIAFAQALRSRMDELGLDEAGLTNKYANFLKVSPDRRRNVLLRMLRGETEPRLKTVLNLLHPQVLNGELLIRWFDSNALQSVPTPRALAQVMQERMKDTGLNPAQPSAIYELTRRYCLLKLGSKPLNPSNHIKVIKQLISDEPNSRLQTIATVAMALSGQLLIRWRSKIRQQLQAPEAAYTLIENLPPEQPLVIEYQVLGKEQEI